MVWDDSDVAEQDICTDAFDFGMMSAMAVVQDAAEMELTLTQNASTGKAVHDTFQDNPVKGGGSFLDFVKNAPPRRGSIYMSNTEIMKEKVETLSLIHI